MALPGRCHRRTRRGDDGAPLLPVSGRCTVPGVEPGEVVYLITSAGHRAASQAVLATWVNKHWSIENKLHHARDPDGAITCALTC